ncbi:hypothetical protein PoB_001288100 [Plakobranchus ocellatus]|uniref:Uncharacterized protein n=1 Tax=Plakobranchus ocellatus TaxID=259542 RepID=A0AAV3YGC9_9GAST|nr:hypothetical protein PoB_001288100 [Plakobranchus ocellatus]
MLTHVEIALPLISIASDSAGDRIAMPGKKDTKKKFMIEVSGVYQTLPALWRIQSDDYSNRAKKAKNYDMLL